MAQARNSGRCNPRRARTFFWRSIRA
jgi:hypothetical protein